MGGVEEGVEKKRRQKGKKGRERDQGFRSQEIVQDC